VIIKIESFFQISHPAQRTLELQILYHPITSKKKRTLKFAKSSVISARAKVQ